MNTVIKHHYTQSLVDFIEIGLACVSDKSKEQFKRRFGVNEPKHLYVTDYAAAIEWLKNKGALINE